MSDQTHDDTASTPGADEQSAGAGGEVQPAQEPKPGAENADEFKSPESKKRVLADLQSERETRRKAVEERDALAARLKELEDAQLSESQKMEREYEDRARRIAELESENSTLKLDRLRSDVAVQLGLPSWAAPRLRGSSEDELRADAEQLKEQLGPAVPAPPARPLPDPSQGPRPGEKPSEDDQLYESIYGTRK
jgi:hypothetical protein